MLPEIIQATRDTIGDTGTVVDLMAGTGSVSLEYRRNGYHVIASDVMTYSKQHLTAQLLYDKDPDFFGLKSSGSIQLSCYAKIVEYLNQLPPVHGYFYQEFSPEGIPKNGTPSRKYFTSDNAAKIDAIREQINSWILQNVITENEAAILKHTLIMAVNRVANISGTYGYYLADFKSTSRDPIILEPVIFDPSPNIKHVVLQGFAEDLAKTITADLCYIDPPYMKRQYAANYHILETIARGDFPEARGKSGLRNWWDQHSKFCTKTRSLDAFSKIVTDMNCPNFLISYSEDGLLSVDQMLTEFSKFGRVSIREINYTRFRSNKSPLPKRIKEYIIEIHK